MTIGREALAEAARLELAAVYGQLVIEHVHTWQERQQNRADSIASAVAAGVPTSHIMRMLDAEYIEIVEARERLGAA